MLTFDLFASKVKFASLFVWAIYIYIESIEVTCRSTVVKIVLIGNRGGWVVRRCPLSYVTGGAQLILAYSWARPAILVAGKDRGGCFYFFCFFTFIPVPLSSLSLSFISCTISSIFFLPFSGRRHKMTHKG